MRLEHEPLEQFTCDLLRIISRHVDLNTHRVFFFGSRVSHKGDDRSDIDVGVEGPAPIPWQTWSRIEEEVDDQPWLYTVDLVDFKNVSEKFKNVALQQIEVINPAQFV